MDSKTYYGIWNRVERAAFMPEKKRVKKWLTAFTTFYNKIVETQNINWPKRNAGKFDFTMTYNPFNLDCVCTIYEDSSKFSFKIKYMKQLFIFDYSDQESCEFDYLFDHCNEKAETIEKETLIEVLKQKIAHPAVHLHLSDNDSHHEIRLGIATKNPFVFLYQFAFQLIAEMDGENFTIIRYKNSPLKQKEINRLADIIGAEIQNDSVSAGKLLGV